MTIGSVSGGGAGVGTFTSVAGSQSSDVDLVTLQMAHTFKNNNGTNVRVHAGLQALILCDDMNYDGVDNTGTVSATDHTEYNAGGVVAGVDLEHMFHDSFSIFSRNQVGLVYGSRETDFDRVGGQAGANSVMIQKKYSVVPTVNAEFGAAYSMEMASSCDVRFEAGVRGTAAIDAVRHFGLNSATGPTTGQRSTWTEASIFFGGQVSIGA